MNAPPRSRCAPAPLTPSATARSWSHDSTEHGPAITPIRPPPIATPSTRTTVSVERTSRLASLNGWRIGTMLSTHSRASRAWRRVLKRSSPIAPMMVRCSPRLTWARSPSASMRRQTSSISASPTPGFRTMIIAIPSRRYEPGARPKKQKGPRAASPSARGPWFVRFALRHGAAGQTVAKVVAEEARPTRGPRPHGGPHGKGSSALPVKSRFSCAESGFRRRAASAPSSAMEAVPRRRSRARDASHEDEPIREGVAPATATYPPRRNSIVLRVMTAQSSRGSTALGGSAGAAR